MGKGEIVMTAKQQDTKDKILDAAVKEFAENGFHQTSVSAIAKEAGLGKGTLYWHFSSKDELFIEIIKREGEKSLKIVEDIVQKEKSPEEKIKDFIEFRLKWMYENKKQTQMFINNENYINQDFKDALFSIHFKVVEKLKRIIETGIAEGKFRNGSSEEITLAVIGVANGMAASILIDDDINLEQIINFAYRFVLDGISIEKRREL